MPNTARDRKQSQPLVRIDAEDKAILDQLSAQTGESTPKLLHRAVSNLKKEIFFESMNSAYRNLRNDKAAWDEELVERTVLDNAASDGLES
jgi:hypothetical protein